MSNVDRRTILATGALALAGTAAQGGTAAAHLAQLLPQVIDHLTPEGQVPTGALGALEGLLDKFK